MRAVLGEEPSLPSLHRMLVMEANERFWDQTEYKRGRRLERSDPRDRQMMPIWMDIYRNVLREHAEGGKATSSAAPAPPQPESSPPLPTPPPPAPAPMSTRGPSTEPPIAPSAGMSTPVKALLVVGGVLVASALGKFVYTEAHWLNVRRQIRRSARLRERAART